MPYLTPDELPEATDCRSLLIPDSTDWLALVSGAISELIKPYNWQQQGSVTPEQAAQAMFDMWLSFVESECGGGSCRVIFRVGITGIIEQSEDGGDTWTAPTGDAEVPAVPAREEPTAEERICLAAANAANVLAQTYEAMLDAWTLDQSVTYGQSVFVATMAGLIGVWLGIISVGAINLALGIFATAYEILSNLATDAWDAPFNRDLTCLLREVANEADGVVTFDFQEFQDGLNNIAASNVLETSLLIGQIKYMLLWIGADGLNHAGATTAITDYDCSVCAQTTWSYTFNFTDGELEGWVVTVGTVDAVNGWIEMATIAGGTGRVIIQRDIYLPDGVVWNTTGFAWQGAGNNMYGAAQIAGITVQSWANTPANQVITTPPQRVFAHLYIQVNYNAAPIPDRGISSVGLSGTGRNPFTGG